MIKPLHFLVLLLALLSAGCGKPQSVEPRSGIPERIISLAPNITETIYALELEDKLVGATTYCTYPAAALDVARVGGFGQYNYEAIVSLQPDLVILHKEYDSDKTRLDSLGIPYLETGSYFIADILKTIAAIGQTCGAEAQAEALIQSLNRQLDELTRVPGKRPNVLITFSGSADQDIEQVHAFGTECIHNELLEIAGGHNVVQGKLPYSTLSREAILRLNPDLIIELAPGMPPTENPLQAWNSFEAVNAVKNKQVHQLTGDYTCIPGPRFIQTLEDFERLIRQNNFVAE
jgi:iron complex transport system substrate-binding protein